MLFYGKDCVCVQQIFELRLVSKEWCDKSFISNFQTGE
jgi:hypothetical protein